MTEQKIRSAHGTSSRLSTRAEIDSFLAKIASKATTGASSSGRLIFALDATASPQATWDTACQLQADMFREAAAIGGLSVQLVYYRGLGDCRASRWVSQSQHLAGLMERIECRMGHTQLGKILAHAKRETRLLKVEALVFVGDAMEEDPEVLSRDADELGRLGVPAFMFQEGDSRAVECVFREIARLTHGAYCRFDLRAARQLAVARGGGLCSWRNEGARGADGQQCDQAARAALSACLTGVCARRKDTEQLQAAVRKLVQFWMPDGHDCGRCTGARPRPCRHSTRSTRARPAPSRRADQGMEGVIVSGSDRHHKRAHMSPRLLIAVEIARQQAVRRGLDEAATVEAILADPDARSIVWAMVREMAHAGNVQPVARSGDRSKRVGASVR